VAVEPPPPPPPSESSELEPPHPVIVSVDINAKPIPICFKVFMYYPFILSVLLYTHSNKIMLYIDHKYFCKYRIKNLIFCGGLKGGT
jgi:hypothetical protein